MDWRSKQVRIWAAGWVALVALQLGATALGDHPVGSVTVLFWIVVIAASGCVATSLWLLWRGFVDDSAELGLIASYANAVSVLPLVHGLTLPGVLYGDNEAVMTAVLWSSPVAAVAALPMLIAGREARLLRHWRVWVVANISVQFALAITLLIEPTVLPFADMGSIWAILIVTVGISVSVAISARHLRLYAISGRNSVLAVSLAFALIACSNLVWVNGSVMTVGFWLAHVLDITGVFAVTIIAAIGYRRSPLNRDLFRPMTLQDPLDALEYGLDPLVREFVADLERKDPITADHVRRTAETAMVVGERLGLTGAELRTLGLGALLHDIGKLRIDDHILNKPDRLTDDEFEHMKRHPVEGEVLVRTSPVLREIAPIVRHHHERIDGRGYPDGLSGDSIPYLARVVSVCDAYDAMAHTRQYRVGMDAGVVEGILREHSGSQWDEAVVETLVSMIKAGRVPVAPTRLADVGVLADCSCAAPPVRAAL